MPERVPSELFQIDGQDEKEGTTQLTCSINLVNLFMVDQSRPFPMLLDVVQALMRRSGSGALAGTLLTFAVKYPGPGLGRYCSVWLRPTFRLRSATWPACPEPAPTLPP